MSLRLQLKVVLLLALTILLGVSAGCSRAVVLYPIKDTDIYTLENGNVCMTPFYLKEVLDVKIKEK